MSIPLTINGTSYDYPETNDVKWGPDATDWASAVTSGMLQKAGGLFQLLAEVDFGTTYGLKSLYYKSRTSNPAAAGQVRLANTDSVSFRNAANSADLAFKPGSSDAVPQYNSIDLVNLSTAQTLTNKTFSLANITYGDGTVGAPSISFTNDSTTGIYRPGSNRLGFTVGGTLALDLNTATKAIFTGSIVLPSISTVGVTTGNLRTNSDNNNKLTIYNGTAEVPVFPVINVKEYGATGDGATDDATAIQAALDAAAPGTKVVYFPKGQYLIGTGLVWPDASNMKIYGDGQGTTELVFTFGGSPSTTAKGIYIAPMSSLDNVEISDMTISGNATNDSAIYELLTIDNGVSNVYIHNVEFRYARHSAVRFTQSVTTDRAKIDNCYFRDINGSGMTGIAGGCILGVLNEQFVTNCLFEDCGNSSLFHAFYVNNSPENLVIEGNTFISTHSDLHLFGGTTVNANVSGNIFKESAAILGDTTMGVFTGNSLFDSYVQLRSDNWLVDASSFYFSTLTNENCIRFGANISDISIQNCKFVDGSGVAGNNYAIFVDDTLTTNDRWSINGNSFTDFATAVYLNGTNLTVQNNYFASGNSTCLYFNSGSGNVCQNNYFKAVGSAVVQNDDSNAVAIRNNIFVNGTSLSGVFTFPPAEVLTATLTDNTSGGVIESFSTSTNNAIQIRYSVKRSTAYETGSIYIISDGSSATITYDKQAIGTPGVTFDADVSGGNIRLKYTTTSTGSDATFKYQTFNWAA